MKQHINVTVEIEFNGKYCDKYCDGLIFSNDCMSYLCRIFSYSNIEYVYTDSAYIRCQPCINAINNSTLPEKPYEQK